VRELKEGETTDDLIRLPDDGELDTWLAVPTMEALLALQRLLPDGALRIVAAASGPAIRATRRERTLSPPILVRIQVPQPHKILIFKDKCVDFH
jgi:hypothetical protein